VIPPGSIHGDGRDVIDFVRFTGTSWSLDLASVVVALKYLEPDLFPGAGVPRLPSHVSHLWLANVRDLSRPRRGMPPHGDGSRGGLVR
jgi:hypothetical protein